LETAINFSNRQTIKQNVNELKKLGKKDIIFKYDNLIWYLSKGYENDSAYDIFQNKTEPETYKIFKTIKGNQFINIGSNVGGYALRAHKNFKKIIALEPNPEVFAILRKNVKLNKLKIRTLNYAIWNKEGTLKLYMPKNKMGNLGGLSTILLESMGEKGITYNRFFKVKTKKLDSITNHIKSIDLLLIDAENAEVEILEGGIDTLHKTKNIIIEVRPNTEEKVKQILTDNGFIIKAECDITSSSKNIFALKNQIIRRNEIKMKRPLNNILNFGRKISNRCV
jgi:FkbM family methyltransferase